MADFCSPDVFWTNQDPTVPWDFGQDDSAPGFDVVLSKAPASESFFGKRSGITFEQNAETHECL